MASPGTTRKADVAEATEEYAKRLGIARREWEQILGRFGRAPNEIECLVIANLWSEEVSHRSVSALLKALPGREVQSWKVPGNIIGELTLNESEQLYVVCGARHELFRRNPALGVHAAVGGALDEFCALGAEPLGAVSFLRFGAPERSRTQADFRAAMNASEDVFHQRGRAVVAGDSYFHDAFDDLPLHETFFVGVGTPERSVPVLASSTKARLLYFGLPSGRHGIVSGEKLRASGIGEGVEFIPPVVDPLYQEHLTKLFTELQSKVPGVYPLNLGAGGISAAVCRLANHFSVGLQVELDKLPRRNESVSARELLLSETFHRFIAIVTPENLREVSSFFLEYDVPAVTIGEVIDSADVLFHWNHHEIASIPVQFVMREIPVRQFELAASPPMLVRKELRAESVPQESSRALADRKRMKASQDPWDTLRSVLGGRGKKKRDSMLGDTRNLNDVWIDFLANPNLCSKELLHSRFDIGSAGFLRSGQGRDAAVFWVGTGIERTCISAVVDGQVLSINSDPYLAAVQMVAEGMRNSATVGAHPIGVFYSLVIPETERAGGVFQLTELVRGLSDACIAWKIPVLGEHVSRVPDSRGEFIISPSVLMLGEAKKCRSVPEGFQNAGERVYVFGLSYDECDVSEFRRYVSGVSSGIVPDIDFELEQNVCEFIRQLVRDERLSSVHDVSSGGLAIALAECCISAQRPLGVNIEFSEEQIRLGVSLERVLFGESAGRFIVSCVESNCAIIESLARDMGIVISATGSVGGKTMNVKLDSEVVTVSLQTAGNIWNSALRAVFTGAE